MMQLVIDFRVCVLALLLALPARAQQTLHGRVVEEGSGSALAGANIFLPSLGRGVTALEDGSFALELLPREALIEVSHVGFRTQKITYQGQDYLEIALVPEVHLEEIIVWAVRAGEEAPVTQKTISRADIQKIYTGQDAAFLLERLSPSIVAYSESGTGFSNYGQFRLRGIDQTRVNITLNGVPLNDMIDQGVFFSNFTDFANSVSSAEVQRGVGLSSNGTASYAGSVNFESISLRDDRPSAELEIVGGSFGTYRASGAVKTGLLPNRTAFYSRFGAFTSDGYRYHSGTDSWSWYGSGGYLGDRDLLKVTAFAGRSKNGLAYLPVALSDIESDPRTNYVNENDRDDFGQWFLQVQHTRYLHNRLSLVSSLYGGGAGGDFPSSFPVYDSIYRGGQDPGYELQERLVQLNYPLTNRHYGLMSNLQWHTGDRKWEVNAGLHAYTFRRRNMEAVLPDWRNPYYDERSHKDELSATARAVYRSGRWQAHADLQLRTLQLVIDPDETLLPGEPDVALGWTFINPRLGLSFEPARRQEWYLSYGYSGREPTKIDLLGGFQLNAANLPGLLDGNVRPEYVHDLEMGYRYRNRVLRLQANAFYMLFRDEIAPIGEFVPEGFIQLRKNMPGSYRRGVEADAELNLPGGFDLAAAGTWMQSRIDEYAPEGEQQVYHNVQPALSPEWMASGEMGYRFLTRFRVALATRYIGESFQEPTNNPAFTMPSFVAADARLSVSFGPHALELMLNNIFDRRYFTYGAPVDLDYDGALDEPGFFVQPPRHVYARLLLKF
jgi:iron complex outermembrane recepter protein